MSTYPDYVHQMLARARDEGQWHAAQADAAALCFDVLALFPDCDEAKELVHQLFCDEWTIYDNRVAIQRNIDEWDDRPWQYRRRLALSFRFMSRWEGWRREYEEGHEEELNGPIDAAEKLDEGKMELLGAYYLGDEECADFAWSIFADALRKTSDPRAALLWIGKIYADLGFFADAAEALGELCSRFNDADARRLLVEVAWWRDNAHRIPWIPPRGDGSRYNRMMQFIDPTAPTAEEEIRRVRTENQKERIAPYRPSIDPQLAELFRTSISVEDEKASPALVDWSFLDKDDGQPGEPADWVKKQMRMFERDGDDEDTKEMIEEMKRMHRWTRNIPPPSTPARYDPNEPPFDPRDILGDMDDDLADGI
ncbi:MAG: hypothetical protein FJZ86_16140 [Chloroflexi bacterium]|nr:hypothetical protein [Chloroflexota bacterium]